MTTLWDGTPFAEFSNNVMQCPTHRLAYFMAQIDQTVFELFGFTADDTDPPKEAREVALIMMSALAKHSDLAAAVVEAGRIVDAWRAGRKLQ